MAQFDLTPIQRKARKYLPRLADQYAELLVTCADDEYILLEVECTLIMAGYTPVSFMKHWANGRFDA